MRHNLPTDPDAPAADGVPRISGYNHGDEAL